MVRCCRDHGFSHPLLDDNQAWIACEACEFERAESIWRTLTSSEVAGIVTKLMRHCVNSAEPFSESSLG